LRKGVNLGLPDGYKCSMRNHWYVIPNILPASDGFFFRRVHHYPKLLKNTAGILVTDTAYQVEMHEGFSIESLIYSFYNSLSLAFAELSGRYYGGGVLELTPSEFKSIPIPYQSINAETFKEYRTIFETKSSIEDVLNLYDTQILNTSLGLSTEEIKKIQAILRKLVAKRFRK
jgi:adenine-specific DNA-methyltransferase